MDILSAKGFVDIDIIEGLNFLFNASYDLDYTRYMDKSNAYYGQSANYGGSVYRSSGHTGSLVLQQLLTYEKSMGDHNFDILLGHETYDRQWNNFSGSKNNLFDPETEQISNAILNPTVNSSSGAYFVEGYLTRAQYNYQQKYFVSASFRKDGSSRFAPENRWGNFWSVGGSWLINKEAFFSNVSFVDMLKLKASYGAQGNDAMLDALGYHNYYPYEDQYEVSNSNDDFATSLYFKGNKDLTWETSYNFNAGFDFSLFSSKLDGSIEYFSRKVEDMLYYRPVSISAGYSAYPDNIGSMKNTGFEIDLQYNVLKTNTIQWDLYLNGTHYKNEIISLPPEYQRPEGYISGSRILKEGGSIYDMWYPVYMGVDENGQATWRTTLEDGTYGTTTDYSTASKQENSANAGTSLPDFQGGFGTSVAAYGVDFSIGVTYQLGGQVYDAAYADLMHGGSADEAGSNWHKDILNSWTSTNTGSDIPMVDFSGSNINAASDRFIMSASYLSINNITLGYTLPASLLESFKVETLRIYVAADNVKLFSKRKGLDPRQSYSGSTGYIYSPIRTMSLGLKLKF